MAIVAVVVLGVAYGYWDQHFKPVASVAGAGISKDQWADRARLEAFRLERQDRRVTQAIASGQLTAAQGAALRTQISTAQGTVSSDSIEHLIDLTFKGQLATKAGVSVTDADVDAAVAADESVPESRQIGLITITPVADASGTVTPAARQAALTAANAAVADLTAGKDFADRGQDVQHRRDQGELAATMAPSPATTRRSTRRLVGAIFAAGTGRR